MVFPEVFRGRGKLQPKSYIEAACIYPELEGWWPVTDIEVCKDSAGIVRMSGQFCSIYVPGLSDEILFLPMDYVPMKSLEFHTSHYGLVPLTIQVWPSGKVRVSQYEAGSNWCYSLDGITFKVD
jgi:hypothetical protein